MRQKTFRVIAFGGLGDILLSTPVFKALKEKHPGCRIILFCFTKEHAMVFKHNPSVDKVCRAAFWANPLAYASYHFKWRRFHDFFYGIVTPSLFYRKSAKAIIAGFFDVELKDDRVQIFLTDREEEKAREFMSRFRNPVIVHITSKCSKNQEWPLKNWGALIRSMPECTFIQLGLPVEHKLKDVVDLRGQTTCREAFAYLKYASGFVGVVSSFSHATNAFGTPGVVLFGASHPAIWGHPNNINLYKSVRCAPCIDLLAASECPYGAYCMSNITVEEVRNALRRQLKLDPVGKPITSHA